MSCNVPCQSVGLNPPSADPWGECCCALGYAVGAGDFRIPASPSAISGYGGYTPYADAPHGGLTQMPAYSEYGGLNTVMQGLSGLSALGGSLAGIGVGNVGTMAGITGKMDAVNLTPQVSALIETRDGLNFKQ